MKIPLYCKSLRFTVHVLRREKVDFQDKLEYTVRNFGV